MRRRNWNCLVAREISGEAGSQGGLGALNRNEVHDTALLLPDSDATPRPPRRTPRCRCSKPPCATRGLFYVRQNRAAQENPTNTIRQSWCRRNDPAANHDSDRMEGRTPERKKRSRSRRLKPLATSSWVVSPNFPEHIIQQACHAFCDVGHRIALSRSSPRTNVQTPLLDRGRPPNTLGRSVQAAAANCAEIVVNIVEREVPMTLAAPIITTDTREATKPYSMAVTPDSSARKRQRKVCIA